VHRCDEESVSASTIHYCMCVCVSDVRVSVVHVHTLHLKRVQHSTAHCNTLQHTERQQEPLQARAHTCSRITCWRSIPRCALLSRSLSPARALPRPLTPHILRLLNPCTPGCWGHHDAETSHSCEQALPALVSSRVLR